jgi:hypothetical protein
MAIPTCPHCKATHFDVTENEPYGSNYKIFIVHCTGCGAPIGPMEYVVTGVLLANQEKQLATIQQSVSALDTRIRRIEQALTRR